MKIAFLTSFLIILCYKGLAQEHSQPLINPIEKAENDSEYLFKNVNVGITNGHDDTVTVSFSGVVQKDLWKSILVKYAYDETNAFNGIMRDLSVHAQYNLKNKLSFDPLKKQFFMNKGDMIFIVYKMMGKNGYGNPIETEAVVTTEPVTNLATFSKDTTNIEKDTALTFVKVVSIDNVSKIDLLAKANKWLIKHSKLYSSVSEMPNGQLSGFLAVNYDNMRGGANSCSVDFIAKENKYKISLYDFSNESWGSLNSEKSGHYFGIKASAKQWAKIKESARNQAILLLNDFNEYMKGKPTADF